MNDTVAVVTGPRGSGKTVLLRALVPAEHPAFIFDVTGQWVSHPAAVVVPSLEGMRGAWEAGSQFIVLPRSDLDGESFSAFCHLAFELSLADGPASLVCDEIARVAPPNPVPPGLARCLTLGRHAGLRLYLGTQRPLGIPRSIFTEATDLYAFKTRYPDDVRLLLSCFPEAAGYLESLPEFHFVHVDRSGRVETGRAEIRANYAKSAWWPGVA